ncbi:zinc-dependent alcohol dehydrogenase [Ruminococcus gauvreauii]|uniref:Zinc-binding dehydrogenase n=1 Tax=Ruminococcus gauvreauii TaxID=438033 RepID=A0ABY5VDA3_9FIRM|nr:zinc-binding dehydrogenase [Ruminococcus gauvreauii]UWP58309.1 zinc-binding dehydrogenase [Ruminococcus gauvreauii]
MRALCKVHEGDGGVEIREVPAPKIKEDELLVRVSHVGICGTDMHVVRDEYPANLPVIMGHEFSGTVCETGSGVSGFTAGDRIVSMVPGYTCGRCRFCQEGLLLQCTERKSFGSGMDGAMAEYIAVRADRVFKIPEQVQLREAALIEPIGCCVRSVLEISRLRAGDYVYVSGPGAMGQIVVQLAKISGANVTVGGTDVDENRLSLAKELGADHVVNVQQEDVFKKAADITGGEMYDVVYECAGAQPSADTCLRLLRKCGQYVQVGLFGRQIAFDMDHALINQKHIVNSFGSERSSFATAIRLMKDGLLKVDRLISREYSLEEWQDAFAAAFEKTGYKIMFKL